MSWQFDDDLERVEAAFEPESDRAASRTTARVLERAQAHAPRKTGELASSGKVVGTRRAKSGEVAREIVFDAPHAVPVHDGHRTTSGGFVGPRPFLSEALQNSEADLESEMSDAMDRAFREGKR